jgi:predicted nucleic acid-binding protein
LVVLDTSALIAAIDLDELDHNRVANSLAGGTGSLIVPVGILSEVTFILDKGFVQMTTDTFLRNLESGSMVLDCGEDDLPRIRELIRRYRDLPLGYADAAVIACAERNGGKVATLDLRHFAAVAREGTIQIVPSFAPAR